MVTSLQIRYFMEAVECRSLSKAADSFFISQPAMSKQIRSLEQELGVVLLKRGSRGVSLTEAGKLVYSHFLAMEREFELVIDNARRLDGSTVTTLRLGVLEDWDISHFMQDVRRRFIELHPQTMVNTACQSNLMTLIAQLRDGQFDVIFLPLVPSGYLEGITTVPLAEVPMELVVSWENPLCQRETLSPAEFRDEVFLVTGHEGFDIAKRSMLRYLEPYQILPEVETRGSMNSVIQGVLNNEGVMLRDAWSLSRNHPQLRCVALDAVQSVCLAYRLEDDSEPLRDFTRLVLAHFSEAAG